MRTPLLGALTILAPALLLAQAPSTWGTMQTRVLDRYCVGCHAVGGYPPAVQTGLILTADSAYRKLLNVRPYNIAAVSDSLVRVSTLGGLPGLAKSYFWHKVNAPNSPNLPQGYGSVMPLGLPFLTNGELAFVNRWISGGAPEAGIVPGADTTLFNDTTRFLANFEPLPPPASGIQLHVGPFNVWSSVYDREFLYYVPYATNRNLFINRYQIRYRSGSHHMILYNYPVGTGTRTPHVYRDIRDSLGAILPPIFELASIFGTQNFIGSQTAELEYSFPPGVALVLPPGTGFDFNIHSVNRSGQTRTGEAYVNLHTIDSTQVVHLAIGGSFSNNNNIFIPPNQTTTITRTFRITQNINLTQMWSHAHQRMIEFKVVGVGGAHNGNLVYYSNDWEHPPLLSFRTPLRFLRGDSVRLIVTYHNPTPNPIRGGLLSTDEMMMLFYFGYGDSPSEVRQGEGNEPAEFRLEQNYPNPFNPSTEIGFQIPVEDPTRREVSRVTLKVFDVLGREVATLVNEQLKPGNYEVSFDASGLSSGTYFYRLRAGEFAATKRMLLVR